jgi:hypothetical protein
MDNSSIKNIQKTLKNSKAVIIKSDDSSIFIKENYGNKYIQDISDSDVDESMSYRKKHSDIVNKLAEKNNSNIKPKLDGDNLSIKSLSVKKAPLRSSIKEKILEETKETKEKIKENIKKEKDTEEYNNNEENNNEESEEEGEEDYDSIEEYEFKDDFENQVKTYVKTDDRIKEMQREIKELNQVKKVAEDAIMKHLERLGETNINITGGKLMVNRYGSKGSFKEDIVKEVLSEKIKDPKIVESIFDKIQEKREENAKIQMGIKRTSAKNK